MVNKKEERMSREEFLKAHPNASYIKIKKPVYRRGWFKKTARATFIVGAIAAGTLIQGLKNIRSHSEEYLARQEAGLAQFFESEQFAKFNADFEREMLWTLNYISKQPEEARKAVPQVTAHEDLEKRLDWTYSVQQIRPEAYDSTQISDRTRTIVKELTVRGYNSDDKSPEERRNEIRQRGRNKVFDLVKPYMDAYSLEEKTNVMNIALEQANKIGKPLPPAERDKIMAESRQKYNFSAMKMVPEMQDAVLKAISDRYDNQSFFRPYDSTSFDVERMGFVYSLFGDGMKKDIHREFTKAQAGRNNLTNR